MGKMVKNTKKNAKFHDFVVDNEVSFYVCDGRKLYSLHDLSSALGEMNDGVYTYHVNSGKNDFYNWIKDVFRSVKLAESLLKASTREDMKKAVDKFIA